MILVFTGCKKAEDRKCFKSAGDLVSESREVDFFTAIDLSDQVNLFIKQGTEQSVEVECGENLMNFIATEVHDNTLMIRDNNKCAFLRSYENKVNVTVTVTRFEAMTYSGWGNVETLDSLDLTDFTYDQWTGSGVVDFKIRQSDATVWNLHTGTGDLVLGGAGESIYVYSACNGFIDARNFTCERAHANTLGTNDFHVRCLSELNAEIYHIGNVYLYGNPINGFARSGQGKGKVIEQ